MPEPTHPPYESGALTTPRQLYRWLDVNAQNGPLTRTTRTFTIPSFDFGMPRFQLAVPYHGVFLNCNVIGMVFNFSVPNVFSLKTNSVSQISSLSNCTIVIASKNLDGTLTRYILWQGTPKIPLVTPVYSGQPINKIFRLEVWVTYSFPTEYTEPVSQIVQTSVKGSRDYRYDTDLPLETLLSSVGSTQNADAFGLALPVNLPMIMPINTYI